MGELMHAEKSLSLLATKLESGSPKKLKRTS
jgi:hypothetical protein